MFLWQQPTSDSPHWMSVPANYTPTQPLWTTHLVLGSIFESHYNYDEKFTEKLWQSVLATNKLISGVGKQNGGVKQLPYKTRIPFTTDTLIIKTTRNCLFSTLRVIIIMTLQYYQEISWRHITTKICVVVSGYVYLKYEHIHLVGGDAVTETALMMDRYFDTMNVNNFTEARKPFQFPFTMTSA